MSHDNQRYELHEVIGRGGMSTVWRATDHAAEQQVAVKVLHEHLVGDRGMVEAFEREAQLMRDIDDPGVVRVFGTTEVDGRPAMVMEHLEGPGLDVLLAERGRFDEDEALEIMIPVLQTLDRLHEQAIVHRDVKPQNILFDDQGRPKLIDFGIGQTGELIELEDTGQVGTVEYMAPERIDGLAVDGRTDVYSSGVVLFELLCGHVPYRADAASAVMRMHREEEVPDPELFRSDLSDRVCDAIETALQKHPERRFGRAESMVEVLRGDRKPDVAIDDHPVWQTLQRTYGGESAMVAPVESEGHEWVVFVVDYDGFGPAGAQRLQQLIGEHDDHIAVEDHPVRNVSDRMRTGITVGELLEGETSDEQNSPRRMAVKWRQMFGAYGLARGLSRQGAEQLVQQLEDIGVVARFAQRRRRRREPTTLSKLFSPDNLAGTTVMTVLAGVMVYILAAQRIAEQGGQLTPALMAGFLGIWVVAAVTSAWVASSEMISELWRSNFSQRYLLDFSRTTPEMTGDYPVGSRHVELARRIQSPRIAASFQRAMNMALHIGDRLEDDSQGTSVDNLVDGITDLAEKIVDMEATVAAIRPGEVAASIRRIDSQIASSSDLEAVEDLMDRKTDLRDRLDQRDRAVQRLQTYGQRLLDIATRLEDVVRGRGDEGCVDESVDVEEVVLDLEGAARQADTDSAAGVAEHVREVSEQVSAAGR